MMKPIKLAICNFIRDAGELKAAALAFGFSGIDWTFSLEDLPRNGFEEARLLRRICSFRDFEIRYHCAFKGADLGDESEAAADAALRAHLAACRIIHAAGGRFMTIHLGLGRNGMEGLSWERSLRRLNELMQFGQEMGITVCLENLASGWSSRPDLFEKLVRKAGCSVTLDIGHARVSRSVLCQQFSFEDFVSPHSVLIRNAHIYHEENEQGHVAPRSIAEISERLDVLHQVPCEWWVLELREKEPLLATLAVVREYLERAGDARPRLEQRPAP